jgi:purine-binding chemotaxis protein CheW
MVALTELPAAPPEMLGLMTVRDRVIPVMDLRRLFGKTEAPLRLDTPIIALATPEGSVGLAVDDVDDVEEIAGAQITQQNNTRSPYINSIARLSDHLLLLVDTAKIRTEAEIPEVQAPAAD